MFVIDDFQIKERCLGTGNKETLFQVSHEDKLCISRYPRGDGTSIGHPELPGLYILGRRSLFDDLVMCLLGLLTHVSGIYICYIYIYNSSSWYSIHGSPMRRKAEYKYIH